MGVKINTGAANTAQTPAKETPPATTVAAPAPEETVVLELVLYGNYTFEGETYVKGTPYRFKRNKAMQLLQESDANRPIWRIHRPVVQKVTGKPAIVDATHKQPTETPDDPSGEVSASRRLEIGSDEEIADILQGLTDGDDAGNVTV